MIAFGLLLALSMICLGIGISNVAIGNYNAATPTLLLALLFVVLAIAVGLIGFLKKKG